MINWKNTSENLAISIIMLFTGAVIGFFASTFAINSQKDIIQSAINKQTTAITNEFKKVKTKDGRIDLNLNNNAQTNVNDSIKRKRFKLFKN